MKKNLLKWIILNNCLVFSLCQMLTSGNTSVDRKKNLWLCQVNILASVLTSGHSWLTTETLFCLQCLLSLCFGHLCPPCCLFLRQWVLACPRYAWLIYRLPVESMSFELLEVIFPSLDFLLMPGHLNTGLYLMKTTLRGDWWVSLSCQGSDSRAHIGKLAGPTELENFSLYYS